MPVVTMIFTLPHLNFNLVECLAVVHSDHRANHLRQDDHVPQMAFNHLWFLHWRSLLFGLAQAFEKSLLLTAKATVQPPPLTGTVQLHELLTADTDRIITHGKRIH